MMKEIRPKYLLDACVTANKEDVERCKYHLSASLLGCAANDELVLNRAIEDRLILQTADKKLAFKAILETRKVVFHDKNNHRKMVIEAVISEYIDPLGESLLENEEIILP